MKITGDFENAIVKIIKEEITEIYKVEVWDTNQHTGDYSEYYTTPVEATERFNEWAIFITDLVNANILNKNADCGCMLRKLRIAPSIFDDIVIEQNIIDTFSPLNISL